MERKCFTDKNNKLTRAQKLVFEGKHGLVPGNRYHYSSKIGKPEHNTQVCKIELKSNIKIVI